MFKRFIVAIACASAISANAAPESAPRPLARADVISQGAPVDPRPRLRPAQDQKTELVTRNAGLSLLGPLTALRPDTRPPGLTKAVAAKRRALRRGSVCGDIEIQGEPVGRVSGKISACGIDDAVRVRSVAGVTLSTGALLNCRTAKALKTWVKKGVKPAFRGQGKVEALRVASHYACRTRNNQPGAKVSEHAKGNAIDISAFVLRSGREVTVLEGWNGRGSKALKRAHKAACGTFGTVLGPNSDRFHRDHFHVDTAPYRRGSYCR